MIDKINSTSNNIVDVLTVPAQAAIADSTTEKTRTQGLGLIGAAFGVGFVMGPIIAFIVLRLPGQNYQAVAFTAAFFSFLSILLTSFWFKETVQQAENPEASRKRRPFSFDAMRNALAIPPSAFCSSSCSFTASPSGDMNNSFRSSRSPASAWMRAIPQVCSCWRASPSSSFKAADRQVVASKRRPLAGVDGTRRARHRLDRHRAHARSARPVV
jgi:MFS family permease